MAKFEPTTEGESLFGKVNGQCIQITRNGSIIKTITQPEKAVSPKQSIARFKTSILANQWQSLTDLEKEDWDDEKTNYTYTNSAGDVITRTPLGVFSFVNQNLLLVEKNITLTPPTFEAITHPNITNESADSTEFVIKGTNLETYYNYIVSVQVHNSVGQISITPKPVICRILTYAELDTGFDLLPSIESIIQVPDFNYVCTIKVCAINYNNGNRDLECNVLSQEIGTPKLGLDIISYYDFNDNLDDYFGINDATSVDTSYSSSGIINKALDFSASTSSEMIIPHNESLNFTDNTTSTPFTILIWAKFNSVGYSWIFAKTGDITHSSWGSYYSFMSANYIRNYVCTTRTNKFMRRINSNPLTIDTWYHLGFTFNGSDNIEMFVNGVSVGIKTTGGAWAGLKINTYPLTVGKYPPNTTKSFNGLMSELTIINQELTESQINTIMDANLNGQTIIDIN